jgi:hypothetical protein
MGKAKSAGRLLAKMMLPGKIDPKVISRAGTCGKCRQFSTRVRLILKLER